MMTIKLYRVFLLGMLLLIVSWLGAQHTISGKITTEQGEPLIGATIEEKGTTNGTITDIDGNYSLTCKDSKAVIIVKYIGYADQDVNVNGLNIIDVDLKESSVVMDQVVVVGYGVQKKSDLTGAVGSLKGKELERVTTPNIEQALQGKIAGVYVAPTSG